MDYTLEKEMMKNSLQLVDTTNTANQEFNCEQITEPNNSNNSTKNTINALVK